MDFSHFAVVYAGGSNDFHDMLVISINFPA